MQTKEKVYLYSIPFFKSLRKNKTMKSLVDRWEIVLKRRQKGDSLETIAKDLEVTRERVRQIEKVLHSKILKFSRSSEE